MSSGTSIAHGGHFEARERAPSLVTLFSNWMQLRRDYRDTVKSLSALSDHELKDLGINRGDIKRIAINAVAD